MPRRSDGELDALRRRLYAPGATEADRERYRAVAGRAAREAPAAEPRDPGPARSAPASSGRRPVVVLVATLVIAAVLGSGVLLARDLRPVPAAVPTPPAGVPPVPAQVLAVPAADRDAFIADLRRDDALQLGLYLYLHPDARPRPFGRITRFERDERRAIGPNTIDLAPSARTADGGRTTVVLVVDRAADVVWTASREAVRQDRRRFRQTIAAGAMRPAAGGAVAATFDYTGAAPTRLRVELPDGVRWGALIAWTD